MTTQAQETKISKNIITKTLDWAYQKAVSGFTGVDSAYELGNSYIVGSGTLSQRVDTLIKWQVAKAATSGFLTGVGGVISMPLTIPANIASVIYVQIRMIAAIAYIGGYDLKDDRVKSLIYMSMVGNGAKEFIKDIGVRTGEKAMTIVLEKVSLKLASSIGQKGVASLGKAIPFVGGIIGGSFDAASTRIVGKVAKRIFIVDRENIEPQSVEE